MKIVLKNRGKMAGRVAYERGGQKDSVQMSPGTSITLEGDYKITAKANWISQIIVEERVETKTEYEKGNDKQKSGGK